MEMRFEHRALDKIYKRRDRCEIPDWQRQKVWSIDNKRRLIDTILRGWKLPKFYFQKTQDNLKDLRTMLKHDVDHGKAGRVAKQRKQLASVFQSYSGVPSPDAVDPSLFALVQLDILGALSTDLNHLAESPLSQRPGQAHP
jgi:hypothetical protein